MPKTKRPDSSSIGKGSVTIVLMALFFSGIASIANQVLWQRALKLFLGGSETISSMVVVLVFMLGLGIGAILVAALVDRLRNPLRLFALLELLLAVFNVAIAIVLSCDISESVYHVQRIAVASGIPLRAVYATAASLILLPPTILMGMTLPVASEACQRQLGAKRTSLITVLFFLNTVGAATGAFGTGFFFLPYYGQRVSLFSAAALNIVAGALIFALCQRHTVSGARHESKTFKKKYRKPKPWKKPRLEELFGFWLGFLSLAYEIYLFRLVSLTYGPLPYNFATALSLFLIFWSCGVYFSSRFKNHIHLLFALSALAVLASPFVHEYDRFSGHFSIFRGGLLYFIPCIGFGALYGFFVSHSARHWGRDVGRFCGLNTLGSCLGIILFTLLGYEMSQKSGAMLISLGLLILLLHWWEKSSDLREKSATFTGLAQIAKIVVTVAMVIVAYRAALAPFSEYSRNGIRAYWGRDGVVEVLPNGSIYIDGLWHTKLSDGNSHIGRSYSWMMAVAAILSHDSSSIEDVLVIGNGVGMTATTLSLLEGVTVDTYEINQTLKDVLRDYEAQTLWLLKNPKIKIDWNDARSGMALKTKKYDIIISAPLHLKQAGSSILLSKEYFALLKSRLKAGGVIAAYSYEGKPEQAMLVRRTVSSQFAHIKTFDEGIVLVASDSPIELYPSKISPRLKRPDPIYSQIAEFDASMGVRGGRSILARMDQPSAQVSAGRYLITDDHPLVEYPGVAAKLVNVPARSDG